MPQAIVMRRKWFLLYKTKHENLHKHIHNTGTKQKKTQDLAITLHIKTIRKRTP
jgi:hypothetical protein